MLKLYNFIESQIDSLFTGQVGGGLYDQIGNEAVRILVSVLTIIVMLLLVLFFGVLLWNQGLASVLPIKAIGTGSVKQLDNDYIQLIVTLLAISMLV